VDKIKRHKKDSTPTLLEEAEANKVIDACNAFIGMTVAEDMGELKISETNSKLILKTITSLGIENGEITTFRVAAIRDVPAA
jgi:hypothetical protein